MHFLSPAGTGCPAVPVAIRQDDEREHFDLVDQSASNPERLHRGHVDQHGECRWLRGLGNAHVSALVPAGAILKRRAEMPRRGPSVRRGARSRQRTRRSCRCRPRAHRSRNARPRAGLREMSARRQAGRSPAGVAASEEAPWPAARCCGPGAARFPESGDVPLSAGSRREPAGPRC